VKGGGEELYKVLEARFQNKAGPVDFAPSFIEVTDPS